MARQNFCVGSSITIADVCLVPQLYNARRFEYDMSRWPRLCAINAHVTTLPPFVASDAAAQPDAAPPPPPPADPAAKKQKVSDSS